MYDIRYLDCVAFLAPFEEVIVSEQASGTLTNAALSALSKFVLYGFLVSDFRRAREGVEIVAHCVTACVFEESDWQSDEVVMLKLLELSTAVYRCDAASQMSVKAAWKIFETCLSIRNQPRVSAILKSEAETTLRHLTLTAFSRAHSALRAFQYGAEQDDGDVCGDLGFTESVRGMSFEEASTSHMIRSPVGLTLLLGKIMTVLSGLMYPDGNSSDVDRTCFALQLVNVALEAGGIALGAMAPLVDVLRGDVCRHLLRASQSEDLAIFSVALRVVFNLFVSIKDHMKTQLEVFLTSVHLRLLAVEARKANKTFSDETKAELHAARQELALESLLEFCREPGLMHDLYTNYDCDVQCTNLFDAIIKVLCTCSLPEGEDFISELPNTTLDNSSNSSSSSSGTPNSAVLGRLSQHLMKARAGGEVTIINELALDGMLAVLNSFVVRLPDSDPDAVNEEADCGAIGHVGDRSMSRGQGPIPDHDPELAPWCGLGDDDGTIGADSDVSGLWPEASDRSVLDEDDEEDDDVSSNAGPGPSSGHAGRSSSAATGRSAAVDPPLIPVTRSLSGSLSVTSGDSGTHSANHANPYLLPPTPSKQAMTALERQQSAEVLRQRKVRKERLQSVAAMFNNSPNKLVWVRRAVELGLIQAVSSHEHGSANGEINVTPTRLGATPPHETDAPQTHTSPGDDTTDGSSSLASAPAPSTAASSGVSSHPHANFPADPTSTAEFMRNTPGLSLVQKGEFLSKGPDTKYPFQTAVLESFVGTFDFVDPMTCKCMGFGQALRSFLGTFRLPGEAQCIDRLMDAFAGRLFAVVPPDELPFKTRDGAFVLAFSTIMLNTDLHNPNIPAHKKMKLTEFVRNNRGIDGGKDIPLSYIEALYEDIRDNAIEMVEQTGEGTGASLAAFGLTASQLQDASGDAWNALLRQTAQEQAPAAFTPHTSLRQRGHTVAVAASDAGAAAIYVHEKDMFLAMAQPVLQAVLVLWELAPQDALLLKTIEGLMNYAAACYALELDDVLGRLVALVLIKCKALLTTGRAVADVPDAALQALDTDPVSLFPAAPLLPSRETSQTQERQLSSGALCSVRACLLLKAVNSLMQHYRSAIDKGALLALLSFLDSAYHVRGLPMTLAMIDDVSGDRDYSFCPSPWNARMSEARYEAEMFDANGDQSGADKGGRGGLFAGLMSVFGSSDNGNDAGLSGGAQAARASADTMGMKTHDFVWKSGGNTVGYSASSLSLSSGQYSVLRRCLASCQWDKFLFQSHRSDPFAATRATCNTSAGKYGGAASGSVDSDFSARLLSATMTSIDVLLKEVLPDRLQQGAVDSPIGTAIDPMTSVQARLNMFRAEQGMILQLEWISRICFAGCGSCTHSLSSPPPPSSSSSSSSSASSSVNALLLYGTVVDWLGLILDRYGDILCSNLPCFFERIVFSLCRATYACSQLPVPASSHPVTSTHTSLLSSTSAAHRSSMAAVSSTGHGTGLAAIWRGLSLLSRVPLETLAVLGDRIAVALFYVVRRIVLPGTDVDSNGAAGDDLSVLELSLPQWHLLFLLLSNCTVCVTARPHIWTCVFLIVSHSPPSPSVSSSATMKASLVNWTAAINHASLSPAKQLILRFVHGVFSTAHAEPLPAPLTPTGLGNEVGHDNDVVEDPNARANPWICAALYCLSKLTLTALVSAGRVSSAAGAPTVLSSGDGNDRVLLVPMRSGLSSIRASVGQILVPLGRVAPRSFLRLQGSQDQAQQPQQHQQQHQLPTTPHTYEEKSEFTTSPVRARRTPPSAHTHGAMTQICSSLEPLSGPHVVHIQRLDPTVQTLPLHDGLVGWLDTVKLTCDYAASPPHVIGSDQREIALTSMACVELLVTTAAQMASSFKGREQEQEQEQEQSAFREHRDMQCAALTEMILRLPLITYPPSTGQVAAPANQYQQNTPLQPPWCRDASQTSAHPPVIATSLEEASQLLQRRMSHPSPGSLVHSTTTRRARATMTDVLLALQPMFGEYHAFQTVWSAMMNILGAHALVCLQETLNGARSDHHIMEVVEECLELISSLLRLLRAATKGVPVTESNIQAHRLMQRSWVILGGDHNGNVLHATLITRLMASNERLVSDVTAILAAPAPVIEVSGPTVAPPKHEIESPTTNPATFVPAPASAPFVNEENVHVVPQMESLSTVPVSRTVANVMQGPPTITPPLPPVPPSPPPPPLAAPHQPPLEKDQCEDVSDAAQVFEGLPPSSSQPPAMMSAPMPSLSPHQGDIRSAAELFAAPAPTFLPSSEETGGKAEAAAPAPAPIESLTRPPPAAPVAPPKGNFFANLFSFASEPEENGVHTV